LETDAVGKQAEQTEVVESQVAVAEVVVTKKGQTTIPVKLRRKYKIEEGTKLTVIDTKEGILFKPKKTIWDMIGAYPVDPVTADKIDKLLYKLRHEEEDDE
jgi:AbrB family looped-hinge helix DNA binding protein